jgi:hypothetical protein
LVTVLLCIFFNNYEIPLTQQSTVAAVQEKYMKDDENIGDDWWGNADYSLAAMQEIDHLVILLHSILSCLCKHYEFDSVCISHPYGAKDFEKR